VAACDGGDATAAVLSADAHSAFARFRSVRNRVLGLETVDASARVEVRKDDRADGGEAGS